MPTSVFGDNFSFFFPLFSPWLVVLSLCRATLTENNMAKHKTKPQEPTTLEVTTVVTPAEEPKQKPQLELKVSQFWAYNADSLKELSDATKARANLLLENSLKADGTTLTAEQVAGLDNPLQAMSVNVLGMDLRNGMQDSANAYRRIVAFISFEQCSKKAITSGLLAAGFNKSRVSEIIRLAQAPANVLQTFLKGEAGWWDSLKLARAKPDDQGPIRKTPANGDGEQNGAGEPLSGPSCDGKDLYTHELTAAAINYYTTATGIPMLEVKIQVPIGTPQGFDKLGLVPGATFATQVKGYGTVSATLKVS